MRLTNAMIIELASKPQSSSSASQVRSPFPHIPVLLLEDERRPNYVHAIDQCHEQAACLQTTVFEFSLKSPLAILAFRSARGTPVSPSRFQTSLHSPSASTTRNSCLGTHMSIGRLPSKPCAKRMNSRAAVPVIMKMRV